MLAYVFPFSLLPVHKQSTPSRPRIQPCSVRCCCAPFAPDGHTECVRHALCTVGFIFNLEVCAWCVQAVDLLMGSEPASQEWAAQRAYIRGQLLAAKKVVTKHRHPVTWACPDLTLSLGFMDPSASVVREVHTTDSSDALSSEMVPAQYLPSSSRHPEAALEMLMIRRPMSRPLRIQPPTLIHMALHLITRPSRSCPPFRRQLGLPDGSWLFTGGFAVVVHRLLLQL